jgi:hypothetical protein
MIGDSVRIALRHTMLDVTTSNAAIPMLAATAQGIHRVEIRSNLQ